MMTKPAKIILSCLLYSQVAFGVAAVATVAMRDSRQAAQAEAMCVNALTGKPCLQAGTDLAQDGLRLTTRG